MTVHASAKKVNYAFPIAAGFFGAFSTVLGKVVGSSSANPESGALLAVWATQAALIGGIVACNIAMWYCFTRFLELSKSSTVASALNLSSNFVTSVSRITNRHITQIVNHVGSRGKVVVQGGRGRSLVDWSVTNTLWIPDHSEGSIEQIKKSHQATQPLGMKSLFPS